MGTTALISEETYRRTSYEPEREYADGVLIDRNVGGQDHSWLSGAGCLLLPAAQDLGD
jgi:hypothetical protein